MIALAHSKKNALPNIVFVHGMCHGAWCWNQGFMQFFYDKGYNCYAIDLTGHAEPGRYAGINSLGINDYVQDIFNSIEKIGANSILVGHSMGGFVVQKYLEQYEYKSAVLLASVPPKGILPAALRYIKNHPDGIIALLKQDIYSPFVKHAQDLYSNLMEASKIEHYKKLMCAESFKALMSMMAQPVRTPVKEDFRLLVLGGKDDAVISTKEVKRTAKFHSTEAILIEEVGHNMMLDFYWDRTAEVLLKWIQ